MEKVTLSSKVFTENPLLDEIIYNIRQLAIGTILKDQDKADNNETLESIKAGDVLISLNRGHYNLNFFYYDERKRIFNDLLYRRINSNSFYFFDFD